VLATDTGNRTSLTCGIGVVQTYGYDPVSRLTTHIPYNPTSQIITAP